MLSVVAVVGLVVSVNYTFDTTKMRFVSQVAGETNALEPPVTIEVNEFNTSAVEKFASDIQAALDSQASIIPITIDSYGGQVYAFQRMADILQSVRVPVATICVGKCMSAGALFLMLGDEGLRFAAPNATIMLHNASAAIEGTLEDLNISMEHINDLNNQIFSLAATSVGKPPRYFNKLIEENHGRDLYFTAKEAQKHNIVNKVRMPELKVKIVTYMTLE